MNLTNRVVKGLTYLNSEGFRDAIPYDKKFIKALLVACIGIEKIIRKEFDALAMEFIQGKKRGTFFVNAVYYVVLKSIYFRFVRNSHQWNPHGEIR